MANYLPVLIVSVSTNTVPDDSSLTTLPRGQVDYLSHDWEEEDVWRSWRNMTRQKNEIANGVRLENASWRTWWKQRNKLKTVTPEKLNWLKDSDVTWLYGPLHTADEWAPPPKHNQPDANSPRAQIDLSTSLKPQKPILKHRSISELLTSDFPPTSPIFSPEDSEDDDLSTLPSHLGQKSKRPILTHTKSDTHITRWGRSAFRKDSPSRVDPLGFDSSSTSNAGYSPPSAIRPSISQDSNHSSTSGSTSTGEKTHKKKHISFNTFVEQYIAIEKPKKNASGLFGAIGGGEAMWTGRNSSVDDDGYEEDQEDSEEGEEEIYSEPPWGDQSRGLSTRVVRNDSDEENEQEEDEDEDEDGGVIEMRSSASYRNTPRKPQPRSQSKASTASSSSTTSTTSSFSADSIRTNSPGSSLSPSRKPDRSLGQNPSSASSTTSTLTARRPSNSIHRPQYSSRRGPPPLIRTPSEHVHVTIAPIAPTFLKTATANWVEGFGDECASDDTLAGWFNSFNGSMNSGKRNTYGSFGVGQGRIDEEVQGESDGTPVELVYVPPFGSNYCLGTGEDEEDDRYIEDSYCGEEDFGESLEEGDEEQGKSIANTSGSMRDVYRRSLGVDGASPSSTVPAIPVTSSHSRSPSPSVPSVVIDPSTPSYRSGSRRQTPTQRLDVGEEDAYGFFGGPDLGEDYYARRGGRGYDRGSAISQTRSAMASRGIEHERERQRERKEVDNGEERQSRSRSRSQSRTPSPVVLSSDNEQRGRRRSSSMSSSPQTGFMTSSNSPSSRSNPLQRTVSKSDLLLPPSSSSSRGRSYQGSPSSSASPSSSTSPAGGHSSGSSQGQTRGRSSTRTSSSSSWDCERSSSVGSSPIGSLSPDGGAAVGIGSVLASARRPDERERGRGRERRGRERTSGKVLSASETESVGSTATSTRTIGNVVSSPKEADFSSTTSSSSSTSAATVIPPPLNPPATSAAAIAISAPTPPKAELGYQRRTEEERRRRVHPTPANSPIVEMRLVALLGSGGANEKANIQQLEESEYLGGSSSSYSENESGGTTTPTASSVGSVGFAGGGMQQIHQPIPPQSPTAHTTKPPHPATPLHISHTPSSSISSTLSSPVSPSKLRPPPLIPSPPSPAKPSTSFTAVSSPITPVAASSQRHCSSSSTFSSVNTYSNPDTGDIIASPIGNTTIVGKAVDIVSNAGVFLGFWGGSS